MSRDPSELPGSELSIRLAVIADADGVARLVKSLGSAGEASSGETDVVARRLDLLLASPGHRVLVAEEPDATRWVGWIHVFVAPRLTVEAFAEIGGLVVDPERRGLGIGRRLVSAAAEWARSQGLGRMRVRSRTERQGAHRFYRRLGFEGTKQQEVLELRMEG